MNKSFYIFGILFLALSAFGDLYQNLVFSEYHEDIYKLAAFPDWVLVNGFIFLVSSLFILKYFHHKKLWFPLISATISTLAFIAHIIILTFILNSGKWQEFYLPFAFLFLGSRFLFGISLLLPGAEKSRWLKTAGAFIFLMVVLYILPPILQEYSQEISTETIMKMNEWASWVGTIIPLFFALDFREEMKEAEGEKELTARQKSFYGMMTLAGGVALIFLLAVGSGMSSEGKRLYGSTCDFSFMNDPSRTTRRNYDSLLAQKEIPQIERKLSTPNPSKEAEALYRYLLDIYGKRTLSGQAGNTWGYDEFSYIEDKTGKEPAIRGMDFIIQRDNEGEVKHAIDWWNSGGIPTIMWHWGAPGRGEGYENSKRAIDIDQCFIEGTKEHAAFWSDLRAKADLLEKTRDAQVPIIWRPFHELNGHWFWYGKQGPERFKKLWITMYDYFVHERELNNLIWVLGYTESPDEAWFPGDAYVDIVGSDTYDGCEEPHTYMYNSTREIVKNNPMPVCYHECGVPPDPDLSLDEGAMWLWWMEWHAEYLKKVDVDYLNRLYHHELVITKDEVPDIMGEYGKQEVSQISDDLIETKQ